MQRKTFHRFILATCATAALGWGSAQAQTTEFSFFFPVAVGGPITRWHDHEFCRDPATRAKLGRPVDGACPEGQVYRRSGEMMHVWFTDDLATAFARRAPLTALRAANA